MLVGWRMRCRVPEPLFPDAVHEAVASLDAVKEGKRHNVDALRHTVYAARIHHGQLSAAYGDDYLTHDAGKRVAEKKCRPRPQKKRAQGRDRDGLSTWTELA